MDGLLTDEVAVVTGASSGIGRAIARTFAEHGADVVVADLRETPREGGRATHELIEAETESRAAFVDCDVTDVDDLEAAMDVAAELGGVDVMVNNAGIFEPDDFLEVGPEQYERLQAVNAKGAFFGAQRAAARMVDDGGGSIVNLSSIDAIEGNGGQVAYSTAKGAVRVMTYAMAHRLGPEGVRVNAVHPGGTRTAMTGDADVDEADLQDYVDRIPLGRMGRPDDVAGAVLFLASDLAGYVTGSSLVVDGGYTNTG